MFVRHASYAILRYASGYVCMLLRPLPLQVGEPLHVGEQQMTGWWQSLQAYLCAARGKAFRGGSMLAGLV